MKINSSELLDKILWWLFITQECRVLRQFIRWWRIQKDIAYMISDIGLNMDSIILSISYGSYDQTVWHKVFIPRLWKKSFQMISLPYAAYVSFDMAHIIWFIWYGPYDMSYILWKSSVIYLYLFAQFLLSFYSYFKITRNRRIYIPRIPLGWQQK